MKSNASLLEKIKPKCESVWEEDDEEEDNGEGNVEEGERTDCRARAIWTWFYMDFVKRREVSDWELELAIADVQ